MSSSARSRDWSKDLTVKSPEAREHLGGIIPPMSEKNHKGMQGRIAVLGGGPDYTGAPFFSSSAALRVGVDMVYTLTSAEASPALKTYSPELMVTPVYEAKWPEGPEAGVRSMVEKVEGYLPRLHAMVIGPGLGRDDVVFDAVEQIIDKAKEQNLPLVMDADSLFMLSKRPQIMKGYPRAVLTPNVMEFGRLWEAVGFKADDRKSEEGLKGLAADAERLSAAMGNIIFVVKGNSDVITDGRTTLLCSVKGGLKRCGGLGDLLSGTIGTTMGWITAQGTQETEDEKAQERRLWACWWSCAINKMATRLAYNKHTRSMSALDVLGELHGIMEQLAPTDMIEEDK